MNLTKEEIIENSKLIAEFMNLKVKKFMFSYNLYNQRGYRILKWGLSSEKELWIQLNDNNFYHSSWNWLMPVLEKIENMDFVTSIQIDKTKDVYLTPCTHACIFDGTDLEIIEEADNKFHAIYKAVVCFINWYNNKK